MAPKVDETPVPRAAIGNFGLVFDAVYTPVWTRLLLDAREAGCQVRPGPLTHPLPPTWLYSLRTAGQPQGASNLPPRLHTSPSLHISPPPPGGRRSADVCRAGSGPVPALHRRRRATCRADAEDTGGCHQCGHRDKEVKTLTNMSHQCGCRGIELLHNTLADAINAAAVTKK